MSDDGYRAALSFFKTIDVEHEVSEASEGLAAAIVTEWGEDEILRGLALVAAVMRDALRQHAEKLGCNCGSDAWLERLVYQNAATEDHE